MGGRVGGWEGGRVEAWAHAGPPPPPTESLGATPPSLAPPPRPSREGARQSGPSMTDATPLAPSRCGTQPAHGLGATPSPLVRVCAPPLTQDRAGGGGGEKVASNRGGRGGITPPRTISRRAARRPPSPPASSLGFRRVGGGEGGRVHDVGAAAAAGRRGPPRRQPGLPAHLEQTSHQSAAPLAPTSHPPPTTRLWAPTPHWGAPQTSPTSLVLPPTVPQPPPSPPTAVGESGAVSGVRGVIKKRITEEKNGHAAPCGRQRSDFWHTTQRRLLKEDAGTGGGG